VESCIWNDWGLRLVQGAESRTVHCNPLSYTHFSLLAGMPYRLMSEAEHNALRKHTRVHADASAKMAAPLATPADMHAVDPNATSSGAELREQKAANLQLAYGAEAPVDAFNGPQVRLSLLQLNDTFRLQCITMRAQQHSILEN
jgi:hypothetical protein